MVNETLGRFGIGMDGGSGYAGLMQGAKPRRQADREAALSSAMRTISTELSGLSLLADAMSEGLGAAFAEAVETLSSITGRVIVTGIGKSGHIGSKFAATLASTGTPAFFVHPSEANHGDLGMIAQDDVIVALSWSGETAELKGIVAYASRFAIPLIAITSRETSALARAARVTLCLPRAAEACPHGLAPTTSTLLQLAVGDALAVALLEARGFTPDHFRALHPGGQLGANLTRVGELMHTGEAVPVVALGAGMRDAILEMSRKGFGCVAVVDTEGGIAGIITDGDLRRHIGPDLLAMSVDHVMTRSPKTIAPDTLAASAIQILNASSITTLMVAEERRLVGILHMHDLLRIGAA